jgi:hypothetical protein
VLVICGHEQAHAPALVLTGAELDDPAVLEGLEGGQAQPHARAARRRSHAVVGHLEQEGPVRAGHPHSDAGGLRVLGGVAQRLGEDGLRDGLEVRRHLGL